MQPNSNHNLKRAEELEELEKIDVLTHAQSYDLLREQVNSKTDTNEKKQEYVQKIGEKYEEMLKNDLT